MNSGAVFRTSETLNQWVIRLIFAQVLISAIALGSGFMELELLHRVSSGGFLTDFELEDAVEANDARQQFVGIGQIVIFILSGILILRWIHRANHNIRALGAQDMKFTPGWAIGWYFVPFANLFKPFQAMAEIWQASTDDDEWARKEHPLHLKMWWILWLASGLLSNASLRLSLRAEELNQLVAADVVTAVADLIGIALALSLLKLVREISESQQQRWQRQAPPRLQL